MAYYITRRSALALVSAAASASFINKANAQAASVFNLPALPYPATALEPHIDAKTMQLHHGKHHQTYVNNLNAVATEFPDLLNKPIQDILTNLPNLPEAIRSTVRNNLGGHVNHTMYWQIMGKAGTAPNAELSAAMERDFGGLEKLKNTFNTAAGKVFGSGWAFVVIDKEGKLALETRSNQDTPLMEGKRVLFGNDVWEHAYYLKYQNKREEYLKSWWSVVNWNKIADRYSQAKAGTLVI
jgi:superoxide dismutase, Fe-Mn family